MQRAALGLRWGGREDKSVVLFYVCRAITPGLQTLIIVIFVHFHSLLYIIVCFPSFCNFKDALPINLLVYVSFWIDGMKKSMINVLKCIIITIMKVSGLKPRHFSSKNTYINVNAFTYFKLN